MPKQTVTIEVDVPEGRECKIVNVIVAEQSNSGARYMVGVDFSECVWPAWLKCDWLAMDRNGMWTAYELEPVCDEDDGYWYANDGEYVEFKNLVELDIVTATDWRQSKRRRPTS